MLLAKKKKSQRSWHNSGITRQPEPCGIVESSPPHGLKPLGAAFMLGRDADQERWESLGYFGILSDEVLLLVLEYLAPRELATLACTSRYMRAFASHDELWLTHCEELFKTKPFAFHRDWKATYVAACGAAVGKQAATHEQTQNDSKSPTPRSELSQDSQLANHQALQAANEASAEGGSGTGSAAPAEAAVFSDYLYNSWFYAAACIDPAWLEADSMVRVHMDAHSFWSLHEEKHQPVILKGLADDWPARKLWPNGGIKDICPRDTLFKAGAFNVTLDAFEAYCKQQCDQRPLYIFDKYFADKCPQLADHYTVPKHFSRDFFAALGDTRPSFRWLIVGPAKSGSTWHKDPNSTAAWNALLEGEKRWIMTPPDHPPPGVYSSPDGAVVASPISVIEWFISYYDALKESGTPYVEGTQRPGDVVFVPHGWWHAVLNTKPSIAVTQNFVSPTNLSGVLRFLRTTPDQVSGVAEGVNLYNEFVAALKRDHSEFMHVVQEEKASVPDAQPANAKWRGDSTEDGVTDSTTSASVDGARGEGAAETRAKKPKARNTVTPFSFNFG